MLLLSDSESLADLSLVFMTKLLSLNKFFAKWLKKASEGSPTI